MTDPHPLDDALASDDLADEEDLAAGGTHLLDLVAAVDFLRRGDRPGLTVWDALDEALRWWTAERIGLTDGAPEPDLVQAGWGDPDPLCASLRTFLAVSMLDDCVSVDIALQQAVRRWCAAIAVSNNDCEPWPHPLSRRADVSRALSTERRAAPIRCGDVETRG